jgi:hypothetical protein
VVGGTAAALTGYPYNPYSDSAYGSYAYAPPAAGSFGLSTAPASQDSCAIDAGYGRLDYSQC